MALTPLWQLLSEAVFSIPSRKGLFNPYRDVHPSLDRQNAAALRRDNLRRYLSSLTVPLEALVVGEAFGPRGGRFSGVPFTSERLLVSNLLPFNGRQTSADHTPYAEASATLFWKTMRRHHADFLVWNAVPLHPHQPNQPLSLRTPRASEIRQHLPTLADILSLLNPGRVFAVGRKAEWALKEAGVRAEYVRHPSHGGASKFRRGMLHFFGENSEGLRRCPRSSRPGDC